MYIIPDFTLNFIENHRQPLQFYFSQDVLSKIPERSPQHILVKLHRRMDLGALEQMCSAYHHLDGPGRSPTHTVPRLLRVLLVGYIYGYSTRQLEEHINYNLVAKWFTGYSAFEPAPDHSTIERFEVWLMHNHPRMLFDDILRQIDASCPQLAENRQQVQIGDTYAMRANAARESLVRLLRHLCQRLLEALKQDDAPAYTRLTPLIDRSALFGDKTEKNEFYLNDTARQTRRQTTALAVTGFIRQVRNELKSKSAAVDNWLSCLDKVLADEFTFQTDDLGQITAACVRPKKDKGSFRIGSATDPQATYRKHGEDKADTTFGYNVQSASSPDGIICETQAFTGATPDQANVADLVSVQKELSGLCPEKLIYDQAAGCGKTRHDVQTVSDGQTQLCARIVPYDKRSERFGPQDFSLSEDNKTLTCPNAKSSAIAYRSPVGDGVTFRFPAFLCKDCPLRSQCRGDEVKSHHMRQVFISDYRSDIEAAKVYNATPDFALDMKQRPLVERSIAWLVRYCGARTCRRRGLAAADYQAKMCAATLNLKRWMRILDLKQMLPRVDSAC